MPTEMDKTGHIATGHIATLRTAAGTEYEVSITLHQEMVVRWEVNGRPWILEHCEIIKLAPGERFSVVGHNRYASEPYGVAEPMRLVTEPVEFWL